MQISRSNNSKKVMIKIIKRKSKRNAALAANKREDIQNSRENI